METSQDLSATVEFRSSATLAHGLELFEQYATTPRAAESLQMPDSLPDRGTGSNDALDILAPLVLCGATRLWDPGFFAHMDPPVPSVASVAAFWNAALNQNTLHVDTGPAAREVEEIVVRWLSPLFGMTAGRTVPGSTIANIEALWTAREVKGVREVVASEAAHVSIRKAAAMLGLQYRAVPIDAKSRMKMEHLGNLRSSVLVLTAGTTSAGVIDPLHAGREAAWRHVDAAWAGPLRFSSSYSRLLDGIETADSVVVSAHKLLFQPKDCALVFFTDAGAADAVSFSAPYLKSHNTGIMGSSGARAVPLLATLLAFGREGMAAYIDRCMALAVDFADRLSRLPEFELFDAPQCGCVLWRARHLPPDVLIQRMRRRAFVSTATVNGEPWLRCVAANPFVEPARVVEAALDAVREKSEK